MSRLGDSAFRGTSRDSLAALRTQVAETSGGSRTLKSVGADLFGVVGVLDAQPTLRRALTDPSRSAEDRVELTRALFEGKIGGASLDVVTVATRLSWSRVRDLADALEYLATFAEVLAADKTGRLDELEDELFRFARIVEGSPELRAALSNSAAAPEHRAELALSLLEGKAGEATTRLVRQAVMAPRGRTLLAAFEAYLEIAAAWRERLVAVVRTAVPLDNAHEERLRAILTRHYGSAVHLNVIIDPSVIGGVRIEVGDEVIDGSVATRLDEARRKLAG